MAVLLGETANQFHLSRLQLAPFEVCNTSTTSMASLHRICHVDLGQLIQHFQGMPVDRFIAGRLITSTAIWQEFCSNFSFFIPDYLP